MMTHVLTCVYNEHCTLGEVIIRLLHITTTISLYVKLDYDSFAFTIDKLQCQLTWKNIAAHYHIRNGSAMLCG